MSSAAMRLPQSAGLGSLLNALLQESWLTQKAPGMWPAWYFGAERASTMRNLPATDGLSRSAASMSNSGRAYFASRPARAAGAMISRARQERRRDMVRALSISSPLGE